MSESLWMRRGWSCCSADLALHLTPRQVTIRDQRLAARKALCRLVQGTFAELPRPKPRKKAVKPGAAPKRSRMAGSGR